MATNSPERRKSLSSCVKKFKSDKTSLGAEVRRRVSVNIRSGFPQPPALRYFASLAVNGEIKLPSHKKLANVHDRNALLVALMDKIKERWGIPKTAPAARFVDGETPPWVGSVIVAAALYGCGVLSLTAKNANEIVGKRTAQQRTLDPKSHHLFSARELLEEIWVAEIVDSLSDSEEPKAFAKECEKAKEFLIRKEAT